MSGLHIDRVRPTLLFIGDQRHPDFAVAVDDLADGCDRLFFAQSIFEAFELLAGGLAPAVIVIAQVRRGQFSSSQIEQLRRRSPLARIVGLLGSWCEGETRSGDPWPGVIRCYWHQWASRSARELMRVLTDCDAWWGLPPTYSDEERLMQSQRIHSAPDQGLLAVRSFGDSTATGLAEACHLAGYATVILDESRGSPVYGATTVLWDVAAWTSTLLEQVQHVQQQAPGAAIIALLLYPRLHEQQVLLNAGVTSVVSKPFLLDDLFWNIEAARAPSRPAVGTGTLLHKGSTR